MKISFNIYYPTIWGQTLHLTGSLEELGSWDVRKAANLQYINDGLWSVCIEVPDHTPLIEYKYFLQSNGITIFEPWDKNHLEVFDTPGSKYTLYDTWMEKPEQMTFYTSAFKEVLFRHDGPSKKKEISAEKNIRLKVFAPRVEKGQNLALTGNQAVLGQWDTTKAIKMSCLNFPEWEVTFDASNLSHPIEYKFIIYNTNNEDICWETGSNRILNLPLLKENETVVVSGLTFRGDFDHWKCAGTAIPVFSLRSSESFGIGDFNDLKKFTDWVKITGQKMIQILPINDTTMTHTWMDSYPYNAISIYALHPLYLNLQQMGELKDPEAAGEFRKIQKELNVLEKIDYENVDKYKWKFFRAIFTQDGTKTLSGKEFKAFFKEHEHWLVPYAAYSYLRDLYQTSDFKNWDQYAVYDKQKILRLCSPLSKHYPEIAIYYFLQYHLHLQLKATKEYAHSQEIILKGDIPIGISNTSIEAWTEPEYFNMDAQAGAPPDDFSASGQNWGFPTYNWERMEASGFDWWIKRFRHMALYFDAYRIDHILGFFRIWEIPKQSVRALYATFNPALPFSLQEIKQAGMHFDKERFTRAQIKGIFLTELAGVYAQEVSEKYLIRIDEHYFALHPDFDTQMKIREYFTGKTDFKDQTIKLALYRLAEEVLFIPDKKQIDKYHPRISASQTFAYRELCTSDKYAFDYLYWDYFYHRQNNFWKEQALKHLTPLISCTDMLVCGEDLGMIPGCVPEVMNELQILSLEIERMPKLTDTEFERLENIPYRSVCTTSTHDMSTIRGWWEEDPAKTQRYFTQILKRTGLAPDKCSPELCRQIIENHLLSPAMLVVLPIQDWMSINEAVRRKDVESERINIPSNPRHYWGYRMHLNIEELLKEEELNKEIKVLIGLSKRIKN